MQGFSQCWLMQASLDGHSESMVHSGRGGDFSTEQET
jgi:hypothetical protein